MNKARRYRLDMHAPPTFFVKSQAHRIDNGVLGAYVDVKPFFDVLERAP